jgi:flagellar motility protein MotE (MotC chaperone)
MMRALPFVIIFMVVMIGSKILQVLDLAPDYITPNVKAAEQPKAEEAGHGAEQKEGGKPEAPKSEHEAAAAPQASESKAPGGAFNADTESDKKEAVVYSPTEVSVLQELSKRRITIEQREKQLEMKQTTLNMLEQSIQQKLDQMSAMQSELQGIIAEYDKHEDEKTARLVRIYEAMKPNEAAQIFEKLEDTVLIEVASKMKEAKLALILAKMDPMKAKELTMELANRRRIKSQVSE